uniref:Integrase_H2C2 domain-containing protein n=1 Tax=Strongyloides papillosus TaxID=174720 RepID=A0A0N5CIT9_STREA
MHSSQFYSLIDDSFGQNNSECGVAKVTMSDDTDNNLDINCLAVNDNVIGEDKFNGKSLLRVYVTNEYAREWTKKIHEQGYFAKAKTLELFTIRFVNDKTYTIYEVVCKSCDNCRRVNRNHKKNDCQKMVIIDIPREIYVLALYESLYQKDEKNKYLMLYRSLYELNNHQKLFKDIVLSYRLMRRLSNLHKKENLLKLKPGDKIIVQNIRNRTHLEVVPMGT